MKKISPIYAIDGYKLSHADQYPDNTSFIYGNFTPRDGKRFAQRQVTRECEILSFGFQAFILNWIKDEFDVEFFQKPVGICQKMKQSIDSYLSKDYDISRIEALHKLGYLPLVIKVVPEGETVLPGTPMLTIQNTLPDFFWLVNYLETLISAEMWPVITAASSAFHMRVLCERWANMTCDNNGHVDWQCHDFSSRGDYGMYASGIAGMAHLSVFKGTDSVFGRELFMDAYNTIRGGSVDATEHSVMCMGTKDGEKETVQRLLGITETGIISVVNDTWDTWNHIDVILRSLKDQIMSRDGKFVSRPDSGNPIDIICGLTVFKYEYEVPEDSVMKRGLPVRAYNASEISMKRDGVQQNKYMLEISNNKEAAKLYIVDKTFDVKINEVKERTPEMKGVVELLDEIFGSNVNSKGFKELDPHVGVLYGDSITKERAEQIFTRLKDKGYASSNVVFGIGAFTYQYITRDTFGFAIKATYGIVDGKPREVFKDPITDPGKKSLRGLVQHFWKDGRLTHKDQATPEEEVGSSLNMVFCDGMTFTESWEDIEERIKRNLDRCVSE